jgi:hypothetical protein
MWFTPTSGRPVAHHESAHETWSVRHRDRGQLMETDAGDLECLIDDAYDRLGVLA